MNKETKIYAENLENTALDQFNSAMEQDFSVKGALMADAHTGYSLPIGGVVATDGVIVPAWVGYDIGCGMCALPTTFSKEEVKEGSDYIFKEIYKRIPVGFNVNNSRNTASLGTLRVSALSEYGQKAYLEGRGEFSLSTLGGGNHFIEIGYDEEDKVWIVIHSGSRGVGHKIAAHYMKLASNDVEKIGAEFDRDHTQVKQYNPDNYDAIKQRYILKKTKKFNAKEGHYELDVDSVNGQNYINDMNWALRFALTNRSTMITRVIEAMNYTGATGYGIWADLINRNHNHAEERDGLWIHRKGATHAEEGMMGVIPGNMRDGSFIVRGKGNPESLYSSSHGAGRVLGRKKSKEE